MNEAVFLAERFDLEKKESLVGAYIEIVEFLEKTENISRQHFFSELHKVSFRHRFSKDNPQETLIHFLDFGERLYEVYYHIQTLKEQYKNIPDSEIYKQIFKKKPYGNVKIDFQTFQIYVKAEDVRDQDWLYHGWGHVKNSDSYISKPEQLSLIDNLLGFANTMYVNGTLLTMILVKVPQINSDETPRQKNVYLHEKQHILFRLHDYKELNLDARYEYDPKTNDMSKAYSYLYLIMEQYYRIALGELKNETLATLIETIDFNNLNCEALVEELKLLDVKMEDGGLYDFMNKKYLSIDLTLKKFKRIFLRSGKFSSWKAVSKIHPQMIDEVHNIFMKKYNKLKYEALKSLILWVRKTDERSVNKLVTLFTFIPIIDWPTIIRRQSYDFNTDTDNIDIVTEDIEKVLESAITNNNWEQIKLFNYINQDVFTGHGLKKLNNSLRVFLENSDGPKIPANVDAERKTELQLIKRSIEEKLDKGKKETLENVLKDNKYHFDDLSSYVTEYTKEELEALLVKLEQDVLLWEKNGKSVESLEKPKDLVLKIQQQIAWIQEDRKMAVYVV